METRNLRAWTSLLGTIKKAVIIKLTTKIKVRVIIAVLVKAMMARKRGSLKFAKHVELRAGMEIILTALH